MHESAGCHSFVASQERSNRKRSAVCGLGLCLLSIVIIGVVVEAQSGRRPPRETAERSKSASPPTPSTSPSGDLPANEKVSLLIAEYAPGDKMGERPAAIIANFIKRLSDSPAVALTPLGKMEHGDVVKRAQAEKASYVVWLELQPDKFQNGKLMMGSPDLQVKYFVYEPGTAEVKAKGKVYYQAMGGSHGRRDRGPSGTPIAITPEAAGAEAAEGVLDWVSLKTMRKHP
jgi:hypothetical protein